MQFSDFGEDKEHKVLTQLYSHISVKAELPVSRMLHEEDSAQSQSHGERPNGGEHQPEVY